MTHQQVLEKAIQKAIEGGFGWPQIWPALSDLKYMVEILDGDEDIVIHSDRINAEGWRMSFEKLIFNHDFAKALWGDGLKQVYDFKDGTKVITRVWQHHLQQMVIAEDPLAYLAENI